MVFIWKVIILLFLLAWTAWFFKKNNRIFILLWSPSEEFYYTLYPSWMRHHLLCPRSSFGEKQLWSCCSLGTVHPVGYGLSDISFTSAVGQLLQCLIVPVLSLLTCSICLVFSFLGSPFASLGSGSRPNVQRVWLSLFYIFWYTWINPPHFSTVLKWW